MWSHVKKMNIYWLLCIYFFNWPIFLKSNSFNIFKEKNMHKTDNQNFESMGNNLFLIMCISWDQIFKNWQFWSNCIKLLIYLSQTEIEVRLSSFIPIFIKILLQALLNAISFEQKIIINSLNILKYALSIEVRKSTLKGLKYFFKTSIL